MSDRPHRCILISDFTIDSLGGYLSNRDAPPAVECMIAPFDQVVQVLMDVSMECWQKNPDMAVVWTRPQGAVPSFNQVINFEGASTDQILREVDDYSALLAGIRDRVRAVFVPIWVVPPYQRTSGMLDMKAGIGVTNTLMRMNLRLAENLESVPNIHLLDTQRWVAVAGKQAFNPKLWYMGKIAFGNEVFLEAARDIRSALEGLAGNSRKLVVLDLDDTLWGGTVGDVGWQSIRLGGHDQAGEAYVDFQRALKALTNRGILLAIASKNDEATALEAIDKHPEMVLRRGDFAGWKINWQDKAQNIADLVTGLNLGLQSVVFIDDNPVERARVREALPEVLVPEMPRDSMLYRSALVGLRCFDTPSITSEDTERTRMYSTERQRRDSRGIAGSLDEWLKSLQTKVTVEELDQGSLQRTAQLLNKTNQMNLSTRRLTEPELMAWAEQRQRRLWTLRVSDRFGDSGLTGILSVETKDRTLCIVDFILSCRVMGRKVEEAMLLTAVRYAQSIGLDEVSARHLPTPKNRPCLEFWRRSGFIYDEGRDCFYWRVSNDYPQPDIELII